MENNLLDLLQIALFPMELVFEHIRTITFTHILFRNSFVVQFISLAASPRTNIRAFVADKSLCRCITASTSSLKNSIHRAWTITSIARADRLACVNLNRQCYSGFVTHGRISQTFDTFYSCG